jgi:hypothetical protein
MPLVPHPTKPDMLMFVKREYVYPEKEAQDRLFDILLGDDGQAWKEAERYLERVRPDLYQKLKDKR